MFKALALAFEQLPDRRIRGVLLRAFGLTLLAYIGLTMLLAWAAAQLSVFDVGWWNIVFEWSVGLMAGVLALMIFPAILTLFAGFFLDTVADAVEDRYYPALPPAKPVPIADSVISGVKLVTLAVVLNLIALPFYLLLPAINLIIFYTLNGFLLGREYFELVAMRRHNKATIKAIMVEKRGYLVLCGAVIALMSTLPIINLLAPVLGTAFMVHISQSLRSTTSVD